MSQGIWGTIELMGHRQHHGLITEVSFAGVQMIRVQVPHPRKTTYEDGSEQFAENHLYSPSSLYGVHESTEEAIRHRLDVLSPDFSQRELSAHEDIEKEHDTAVDNHLDAEDDGGPLY